MRANKLALTYVLLVGVPVLALFGILRAGRLLTAPVSMGGIWDLDANFNALGSAPCVSLLNGIDQPFFTISQSGTSLLFAFDDPGRTTVAGAILGATVSMGMGSSGFPAIAEGNCRDTHAVYLQGQVSKQDDQRILTGVLGIHGCARCVPIPFRAVRQPPQAGGDR
jgi:hypothetical protein